MKKTGALRAFQHRNFRLLFPANLLSNTGTWAQRVAQDWLVLELTNSPTALGIVTGLQFLPSLLLSLYGGVLADRFNKRKLLMLTNLGTGLGSALLGLIVVTNNVQLWHVYVLALVVGVFSAIDAPIRTAFTSELVGKSDIGSAVSLNSANFNVGRLIGPAASGFLIALYGTGWSFLINAVTYLIVVIAIAMMREGDLHKTHEPDGLATIRSGFTYVRTRPDLMIVMATVFFGTTFGLNFQVFNALIATQEFNKGPAEFGGLGSVIAIGSLSGALIAARLERHRTPRKIIVGMVAFGIALSVLSQAPTYLSYSILLPVAGAFALVTLISANSYVQTTTDAAMRGRVMGIYLLIFMGGTPIGAPLLGALADAIGIRPTMIFSGIVTAASAVTFFVIYSRYLRSKKLLLAAK